MHEKEACCVSVATNDDEKQSCSQFPPRFRDWLATSRGFETASFKSVVGLPIFCSHLHKKGLGGNAELQDITAKTASFYRSFSEALMCAVACWVSRPN
jgi:hypothetical protein